MIQVAQRGHVFRAEAFECLGGVSGKGNHHIQMDSEECISVVCPQQRGDHRAPITALCGEAIVAKALHQLHPHIGNFFTVHAGRGGWIREAVSGHRGQDDIKGIGRVATMGCGVGEGAEDLFELDKRTRPAMGDAQGHGIGSLALFMDEMNP